MPRSLVITAGLLLLVFAVGAVALRVAAARWDADSARIIAGIRRTPTPTAGGSVGDFVRDSGGTDGPPSPVRRWMATVFQAGVPAVSHAVLRHEGEMFLAPDADATPFTSVQHMHARPAGFVWDARARLLPFVPFLPARIRDRYVRGTGGMLVTVGGLVPLVDQQGTSDMAVAALMRWAAEGPWLPTALLPHEGVRWEPRDDHSATLIVDDAGTSVALTVHFADDGTIDTIVGRRPLERDGRTAWYPWGGRHSEYRVIAGMRIPTRAEVWWELPEGRWVYYRSTLVDATYD